MRPFLTYSVLILLVGLIGWMCSGFLDDPSILPPDDFVEYWAAGKLNLHGRNPYDPLLLHPLERREANREDMDRLGETIEEQAVMMWNPPWTLTIAMPLGMLKPRVGQLLWMMGNFAIVGFCAFLLWRLYGGKSNHWGIALGLAFLYMPTVYCISSGQISAWILLGITLFLLFEEMGLPYLAGAAGVLMAIKPHLVYLFWPALLGWSFIDRRGWKIFAGGVVAGAVCTLIPLAFNSQVIHQYLEALGHRPPERFQSPTLGTLLRMIEGMQSFAVQFLPMLLGFAWLAYHVRSNRSEPWVWKRRMPALVIASFITASYGAWPYDLLILLPAIIDIACRIDRRPDRKSVVVGILAFASIVLPMLVLSANKVNSFWFLWAGPLIALEYTYLTWRMPR